MTRAPRIGIAGFFLEANRWAPVTIGAMFELAFDLAGDVLAWPVLAVPDLHTNVSVRMSNALSAFVACRSNPHADPFERGAEVDGSLLNVSLCGGLPLADCAWSPHPHGPDPPPAPPLQRRTAARPVCAGKVMAGLIGLARQRVLRPGERVLFLHTGGPPSLFADQPVVLGDPAAAGTG